VNIFVTGGAGYIGSHTIVELLLAGHEVTVVDNFSNSCPEALNRVKYLTGAKFRHSAIDLRDRTGLLTAMRAAMPDAVVHLAGLKAVGESSAMPLAYYDNNVTGSLRLLEVMEEVGCDKIVLSSSATVYGQPLYLPYDESHPLAPTNPYGRTKLMVEEIIKDWVASDAKRSGVLLRYFNPVGAHKSGTIGEDPIGPPNNLMPYVAQVAVGRRDRVNVFGNDYPTADGTGERDYIHVVDLAHAHIAAVNYANANLGCEAFNIGTGSAYSVLEIVRAFSKASGRQIPYEVAARRQGDLARMVACVKKAQAKLGWRAELSLDDMCRSTWDWQATNPAGYAAK